MLDPEEVDQLEKLHVMRADLIHLRNVVLGVQASISMRLLRQGMTIRQTAAAVELTQGRITQIVGSGHSKRAHKTRARYVHREQAARRPARTGSCFTCTIDQPCWREIIRESVDQALDARDETPALVSLRAGRQQTRGVAVQRMILKDLRKDGMPTVPDR